MLFEKKNDNETNFWLSYADLMAGLLFVFILLIGAILVKSTLLKNNLDSKENSLMSSQTKLQLREREIKKLRNLLAKRDQELNSTKESLRFTQQNLELRAQEIQNLNNILLSQTMQLDEFNNKIIIMQNLLSEFNTTRMEQEKELQDYKNRVLVLSNTLSQKDEKLQLQDKKLLSLLQALDEKETEYDALIAKLQEQKARIKTLTGIKIKVITALKNRLKDKVEIDPTTGSLRLSSNILFDKGSAKLKESSKQELKKLFIDYIGALMSDRYIKEHLERIIIEGHTDSDGGYLFNLELSQKRAFAVMNYLLSLDFTKKNKLTPLLVASGRSYLDTIKDKNGREIKSASRRIEIKFKLKNDDAMSEINRILDYE